VMGHLLNDSFIANLRRLPPTGHRGCRFEGHRKRVSNAQRDSRLQVAIVPKGAGAPRSVDRHRLRPRCRGGGRRGCRRPRWGRGRRRGRW
jgi:hypothetical protein